MEPDERQDSKLADVQTETETTTELTPEPTTELTPETSTDVKAAKMKKNPKRVEQGKKLAEWNRANKRRQLEAATRPLDSAGAAGVNSAGEKAALKPSASTKGDTKDYFLIGETIVIYWSTKCWTFLLYY